MNMKREWRKPNFNVLGVDLTESGGPTAYYLMTGGPSSTYEWTCSCCGDKKGGFDSEIDAKNDFDINHSASNCRKWNYDIDACTIS